jgi:hypothetical protein
VAARGAGDADDDLLGDLTELDVAPPVSGSIIIRFTAR